MVINYHTIAQPWIYLINVCCISKVPSSYVSLQQAVLSECERLRREDQPPVLNEEEFAALAKSDPKSDILDAEELQLGECIVISCEPSIPNMGINTCTHHMTCCNC